MATNLPAGTRDSLNTVLQLGYPFGLRQTNHNLWERDERDHQEDIKLTLGPREKAKRKETALEVMFESREQVQEWRDNFPADVPLCALMEQRQYLIDNGLLEREKNPSKASGECIQQCVRESEDEGEHTKEANDGTQESDSADDTLHSISEQDGMTVVAEVITCGSSQGENSSIGSKDQVMELRKAEEAEEHDKTDNTTQIPAIADDDVVGLEQVCVNKMSEGPVSQQSLIAVAVVVTCGSADGDDTSTAKEQRIAQRKDNESVLSHNEESLALPEANSSMDTVERPEAVLDGSESEVELPRERRRIRRMWKAICRGLEACFFPACLHVQQRTDDSNRRRRDTN